MKKIIFTLAALAAISTASFACDSRRDCDLRDSGLLASGYGTQLNGNSTSGNALAVVEKNTGTLTAFEVAKQNAVKGERNENHN
jgi:hypothetical protein